MSRESPTTEQVITWLSRHPGKKVEIEIIEPVEEKFCLGHLNGFHSSTDKILLCVYAKDVRFIGDK